MKQTNINNNTNSNNLKNVKDFFLSVILIISSILLLCNSLQMSLRASLFPIVLLSLIIFFNICFLFSLFKKNKNMFTIILGMIKKINIKESILLNKKIFIFILLIIFYNFLIHLIGFYISSFIFMVVTMQIFSDGLMFKIKNFTKSIIVSASVVGIIYFLASYLLEYPMN